MNNNQTIEKLKQMRLGAMAELHLQNIKNNQFNGGHYPSKCVSKNIRVQLN